MGMWQGRLSSLDFENGYEEANIMRRESEKATAAMANSLGIELPRTREQSLSKQLEETRAELRQTRARIEWLENRAQTTKPDQWQVNSVQRAKHMVRHIAKIHGLTTEEVIGDRRYKDIVRARQCLMWEMTRHVPWSLPRIGRFCGDRDHTTVLHARNKVQKAIEAGTYAPIVWPWEGDKDDS